MALDIPVYTRDVADIKMGKDCSEMKVCPKCGKQHGVFLSQDNNAKVIGFNLRGQRFDSVTWEQWKCLSCGKSWIKAYGVCNE